MSLVQRALAQWVVYGITAKMLPNVSGLSRLQFYSKTPKSDAAFPSAELPDLSFMLRGKRVWDGKQTREWLLDANG